jgi:putative restriction endonuclease
MSEYVFGDIQGTKYHDVFPDRMSLRESGVHRPLEAGISGKPDTGAESIVLNGGYDNEDQGDVILYCGQGGDRDQTGTLKKDQDWKRGNGGLRTSCLEGLPVRVIRGPRGNPEHSPEAGYRFDGLYLVTDFWQETGKGGFLQCRFKLTRLLIDPSDVELQDQGEDGAGEIRYVATQRRVRNTAVTQWVKELYAHTCQVCGVQIETPAGPYAEGAHVVPLGKPHRGPDSRKNVLCLCPNCHVKFDRGTILISEDLEVVDRFDSGGSKKLKVDKDHALDPGYLASHRDIHEPD